MSTKNSRCFSIALYVSHCVKMVKTLEGVRPMQGSCPMQGSPSHARELSPCTTPAQDTQFRSLFKMFVNILIELFLSSPNMS